jgi:muramoyltetrapeptide carboxypeptidase
MMIAVKPPRLSKGDTIGIISPASPTAARVPRRFERGVHAIEEMGYSVKIGRNARKLRGHKAGTIQERVDDLHEMFQDEEVKAIITSIGGYNSNELLPVIDYRLVKENPKILCGYSDITSLLCGIHSQTGLVIFYGPQVLPQFGDFGGLIQYTRTYFGKLLTQSQPPGRIEPSTEYTYERLEWDREDNRPRKMMPATGWKILKDGKAHGKLVGGHIGTMASLAGTKYLPSFKDTILFWEDTESSTPETDRVLCQLKTIGVFEQIRGMIVGRTNPNEYVVYSKELGLHEIILESTRKYDFPIIAEMDFGHTDPMFTIPYGIEALIDTGELEFSIMESAVR